MLTFRLDGALGGYSLFMRWQLRLVACSRAVHNFEAPMLMWNALLFVESAI
jgi:hypothetical protein